MSTFSTEQLTKFARDTVLSRDLDPMYDFMYNAGQDLGQEWLDRFALHFFMFYHAGEAIKAASHRGPFWQYVNENYEVTKRGTERRHFRGAKGAQAVVKLQTFGQPSDVWFRMWGGLLDQQVPYTNLLSNLEQFKGCQIGPYFAWKAMDILDRCMGMPVSLSQAEAAKHIPDEPRECALAIRPGVHVKDTLAEVLSWIHDLPAAGFPNRPCGLAEAETILCMIKGAFITKTHTLGDDVDEKHRQLQEMGVGEFRRFLPEQKDWKVVYG